MTVDYTNKLNLAAPITMEFFLKDEDADILIKNPKLKIFVNGEYYVVLDYRVVSYSQHIVKLDLIKINQ
jgi:hypothetical protein